jgi:catechol 2,3-dioxygenase-like lactoylglutathione lyase family enzyme
VRCRDLGASRAFYGGLLGLPVIEQWNEEQGRGMIFSVAPGATLETYEMRPSDPRYDPRFLEPMVNDKVDLQLDTKNLEEWAVHLRGRWKFTGPEDLPWGQRWIKLRDPDGLLIAICSAR